MSAHGPDFWRRLVRQCLPKARTPFYLFSATPIAESLAALQAATAGLPVPVRHWLSCKTQPLPPWLRWWQQQGHGIEVVSEFELLAARHEGYLPDRILVNGPAKDHWLRNHHFRGLRVNFDSPAELEALLPLAKSLDWRLGIRCHTRQEYDPENPARPTQFGMMPGEAVAALRRLIRAGVRLETVHFHLRTNVASPGSYARALAEVAAICRQARFQPKYLDCGGGWPPSRVRGKTGRLLDADFDLAQMRRVYASVASAFPGLGELWLENGRFVTARSGVLVVRVLAVKERRRRRFLICDGGRTMNALVSNWEVHDLFPVPPRTGPLVPTTVCGPTCMAFDQLARCRLPVNVRVGDCLVWTEAGAYHLPWETRFSHGYAAVIWHQTNRLTVVRPRESFEGWWGMWNAPS